MTPRPALPLPGAPGDRPVVFDGAVGTMLIAAGLPAGTPPELWTLERPEDVAAVHAAYASAGADVLTANTFGATPPRLERAGLADRAAEVNRAGLRLARDAAHRARPDRPPRVALSMGPTGRFRPPVGDADPAALRAAYDAQLDGLDAPPDLVLVETAYDPVEAAQAVAAVRARFPGLPVGITWALTDTPHGPFTMMGLSPADCARAACDAGATFTGANCGVAPPAMERVVAGFLAADPGLPLVFRPNAGEPRPAAEPGAPPSYPHDPSAFAAAAAAYATAGAAAVGGCCGTTPETVRALARALADPGPDDPMEVSR